MKLSTEGCITNQTPLLRGSTVQPARLLCFLSQGAGSACAGEGRAAAARGARGLQEQARRSTAASHAATCSARRARRPLLEAPPCVDLYVTIYSLTQDHPACWTERLASLHMTASQEGLVQGYAIDRQSGSLCQNLCPAMHVAGFCTGLGLTLQVFSSAPVRRLQSAECCCDGINQAGCQSVEAANSEAQSC